MPNVEYALIFLYAFLFFAIFSKVIGRFSKTHGTNICLRNLLLLFHWFIQSEYKWVQVPTNRISEFEASLELNSQTLKTLANETHANIT